jgi:Carboxypeptidase regulatory-like domain
VKMSLWMRFCVIVMGVWLAAAPKTAWAQAVSSVHGTVTDPSGAVVAKATVHLIDANSVERVATTDDKGRYAFANVAPGTYEVRVVFTGFDTFEQAGVQVSGGAASTLNAQLRISSQRQDITVHTTENAEHLNAQKRLLPNAGTGIRAIHRDAAGRYYVLAAPGATVDIYTPAGVNVGQVPAKPAADSKIVFGEDFYLDPSGRVYVADRGANEIKVYAADGTLAGKIPVTAPVSVAALEGGEIAVASLASQRFVDVYDASGRRVRSIGGTSNSTDITTPNAQLSRGFFAEDGTGHFYYSLMYLPDPTIRKYDEYGYAAYEIAIPSKEFITQQQGTSFKFGLRPSGPGERSAESTDQGIGGYGGAGVGHEFGGGGILHHEGGEGEGGEGEGHGGAYGHRDTTGVRASVKIQMHGREDEIRPEFDAIGVDPATQEVWGAVGNLLFHFDKDGNRIGVYSLYSTELASIKPNVILVEADRLVMAADPFGIFAFPRPDLLKPALPVSAPAIVPATPPSPTSAP